MVDLRLPLAALALTFAMTTAAADFSEQLDKLWNYGKPAESETRFRAELAKYPEDSREALEITTQIARTDSLQRKFAEADKTLDGVLAKLHAAPERVKVRYFLERGRTRNSSGDKPAAIALFREALTLSRHDTSPGADFYRVDALHMLGIAAPGTEGLDWNLQAIGAAEASPDPRARGWLRSLYNNIGWTYFEAQDPKTALAYWLKALPLHEAAGNATAIRVAKWTVARGQRALGNLDEAQALQLALAAETEQAKEPDGYVYEELAEIALARGKSDEASKWAAKAHALLEDDAQLKANEAARLARLSDLAQGKIK